MSASDPTTFIEFGEIERFFGYRFGSDGSVWSRRSKTGLGKGRGTRFILGSRWEQLKALQSPNGYLGVYLKDSDSGKCRRFLIHRLILEAFRGPCPPGMQCCHNDGDPTNNHIENIRWDTLAANGADRVRHGKVRRGQLARNAKLTDDAVREIRRLRAQGEGCRPLARRFGVSRPTIRRVCDRKTWTHV